MRCRRLSLPCSKSSSSLAITCSIVPPWGYDLTQSCDYQCNANNLGLNADRGQVRIGAQRPRAAFQEAFADAFVTALGALARRQAQRQLGAELAIVLEVPFPAHGFRAAWRSFGIKQDPMTTARRARSGAAIVLRQAPLKIGGPPDIGSRTTVSHTADQIDEAGAR